MLYLNMEGKRRLGELYREEKSNVMKSRTLYMYTMPLNSKRQEIKEMISTVPTVVDKKAHILI
jgi:hypothetical protein